MRQSIATAAYILAILFPCSLVFSAPPGAPGPAEAKSSDKETVDAEHGMIGGGTGKVADAAHNPNPGAQWYPDAGMGLFLHWGIASVKGMNISWPMIPGRALAKKHVDAAERDRIVRERDYNLNGKPPEITPNQYWSMATDFNPTDYDPEQWCKAAKAAGFTYVVLTTKHHEGFALWPSAYGNFNTKNHMGGRDLLKDYVAACRRNGLKVGFYFSGPDWHFDRDYMNFLYHGATNPLMPALDADLNPRTEKKSDADIAKHQAEYAAMFKGQVEELLTHYGKIDLLWFDGRPGIPNAKDVISIDWIRSLQPGIVVNERLFGQGDYITYERNLPKQKTGTGWAEFCNPWTGAWPYTKNEHFRSNGFVLGQLAECRSMGVNMLLGIGPMANGQLSPDAYKNMAVLAEWMKNNGIAVHAVQPLPAGESASVPATAAGPVRYLYAIPKFKNGSMSDSEMLPPADEQLTLSGIAEPTDVKMLSDGTELQYNYADKTLTVQLPAEKRTKLVDVVEVDLPAK